MLIIYITIVALIVGYVMSLAKTRFPVWSYILVAFVGSLLGAFLSFGDSPIFLQYKFLSTETSLILFSLLTATTLLLIDKNKFKLAIVTIFVIIASVLGVFYIDSSPSDYSGLFKEELTRAGVERVGMPIEGFSAPIYLNAFPGFEEVDFDRVESLEGIYTFANGTLQYERTTGNPVTSAEDVISDRGYATLLANFSKRVGVEVRTEADIATILEKLRDADEEKASYGHEDFSIWYPEGWYPYESGPGVFFVHDSNLEIPQNTEWFALGSYFQVTVQKTSLEDVFSQNLWTDGSEFLLSKDAVLVNGMEGTKLVTAAAGAGGEILHYVFAPDGERVFILSQYPYKQGSNDTDDFERAVQTFMPNYTINR